MKRAVFKSVDCASANAVSCIIFHSYGLLDCVQKYQNFSNFIRLSSQSLFTVSVVYSHVVTLTGSSKWVKFGGET